MEVKEYFLKIIRLVKRSLRVGKVNHANTLINNLRLGELDCTYQLIKDLSEDDLVAEDWFYLFDLISDKNDNIKDFEIVRDTLCLIISEEIINSYLSYKPSGSFGHFYFSSVYWLEGDMINFEFHAFYCLQLEPAYAPLLAKYFFDQGDKVKALYYARYCFLKCATRDDDLLNTVLESMEVSELLDLATDQELYSLTTLLRLTDEGRPSPKKIEYELASAGGNSVMNFLRDGKGVHYYETVLDVADKLDIPTTGNEGLLLLEEKITATLFAKMFDEMTNEQQHDLLECLKIEAKKHGKNFNAELTGAAAIAAVQASGFGAYLFATSMVGAITSAIGITLPFAFYTSMTSIMSTLTGPVGWALLGIHAGFKVSSPNYKKTQPCVAIISGLRQRLKYEICDKELAVMRDKNLFSRGK